ncbi:MAG: hypothetical protein D4R79_14235 [Comamonadaceae bacterium]|nr:MAG: hypothetical protein D4R79_14235 [Comamonadaceae bacterium]
MQLTKHAQTRTQQRAIPPMLIDLLLQFGSSERSGAGVSKVFFDKASRRKVKAYAGSLAGLLDAHLDVYAVVTDDMTVITAGHRTGRFSTH